jgi:RNA polymerase sigma factor (sigma-70 family)
MRAEEAMADAFAEAARTIWTEFVTWDADRQRAWLRHRAKCRAIDAWRKTKNVIVVDDLPDSLNTVAVEDVAMTRATVDKCWKVINGVRVSFRQRQAAYLRWGYGMSMSDVAAELGVDRATVARDLSAVVTLLELEVGDELPWRGAGASGQGPTSRVAGKEGL